MFKFKNTLRASGKTYHGRANVCHCINPMSGQKKLIEFYRGNFNNKVSTFIVKELNKVFTLCGLIFDKYI